LHSGAPERFKKEEQPDQVMFGGHVGVYIAVHQMATKQLEFEHDKGAKIMRIALQEGTRGGADGLENFSGKRSFIKNKQGAGITKGNTRGVE